MHNIISVFFVYLNHSAWFRLLFENTLCKCVITIYYKKITGLEGMPFLLSRSSVCCVATGRVTDQSSLAVSNGYQ